MTIFGILAATGSTIADDGGIANRVWHDALLGASSIVATLTVLFLTLFYLEERGRRKEEAARRESELEALRILNGAGDAVIAVNKLGNIRSFNSAAVLMFGCPIKEAFGQSILRFLPAPPHRPPAGTLAKDMIGVRADGSTFPVDFVMIDADLGAKRIFMIFVRDISARKNTETALQNERNFSAAVLETADALIVVLDRQGRIVKFNRAGEETTGYTFVEIKGRPIWEVFASPEEFDAMREETLALIESELPSRTENVWRTRLLSPRHIAWSHSVLRDKLDQFYLLVSIGIDVTERRVLEGHLVQARKMEAIGRLAGGVAHDFNNLLTAITGYSGLILNSIRDNDPIRRDVEEIKRAGDRATALTRQLLAFSRKHVLANEAVDLNRNVSNTGRMLERLLGAGIEVKLLLDNELKPIMADPGQLDQVIVNLALNSRDAMPNGGTLTIETSNVTLNGNNMRTDPVIGPGSYVMLRVIDTGTGMDQETLSHIFEPFFTTKEPGMGTGLGLATVYGIVRQSNGAIGVTTELGKGSCFTIYFPLAGAPEAAPDGQFELAKACEGTETILIVEYEEEVRTMMARVLERSGYQVIEAGSGVEAVDRSRNRQGPIHLMIVDVVMTGMTGPELAEVVVTEKPGMRTLFMSSNPMEEAGKYGIQFYLEKPVRIATLPRKVREALDAAPKRSAGASAGN